MLEIFEAHSAAHYRHVRRLMRELNEWDRESVVALGLDADAMAAFYYANDDDLPGPFAPPDGCLLLASDEGEPAGCAAFRRFDDRSCEMKRVYVSPTFRGRRVGRDLVAVLLAKAAEAGYATMRLETTTFMRDAVAMYEQFGFRRVEPYYEIPEIYKSMTIFMERRLM
jgi:ribosomal protein S18 acetylase RimI-like enzyme